MAKRNAIVGEHSQAFRYLEDCIAGLSNGAAGVRLSLVDGDSRAEWTRNAIRMLFRIFEPRASGVSVTWLRPADNPQQLQVFQSEHLLEDAQHYKYRLGEGLAGRVWQTGDSASHHPSNKHRWWQERVGCENTVYVCACVGLPAGKGGVLGVGSDAGFSLDSSDEDIVCAFAALLASVTGARLLKSRTRRELRQHAEALAANTSLEKSNTLVSADLAEEFNELIAGLRQNAERDPSVNAIGFIKENERNSYGELSTKLNMVLRVIDG
jgi:hypothetical protein